jgi:hypothetical protein
MGMGVYRELANLFTRPIATDDDFTSCLSPQCLNRTQDIRLQTLEVLPNLIQTHGPCQVGSRFTLGGWDSFLTLAVEGWITQYDTTYNAWFYVNTRANPPRSEWKHPADLFGQQGFAPPGGPPPVSGGSAQSYYQGTDSVSPYPQQPQQPAYGAAPGGYSPYPAGSPYPQQPQQQYAQTPGGSDTKGPMGALGGAAGGGAAGGMSCSCILIAT